MWLEPTAGTPNPSLFSSHFWILILEFHKYLHKRIAGEGSRNIRNIFFFLKTYFHKLPWTIEGMEPVLYIKITQYQ